MADASPAAQRPSPMRSFAVVWIGQAFSLLGSQLVQFAIVWWLTRATGSATMLALATLVALLPQIILGPFAGVLVDRWSRRKVMIVADTAIAAATLLLALLFWLDVVQIWHIYLLLLVRATGSAFHWPAMQASTPLMVPQKHLPRIAGLNQTLGGLAGILIPPLGALAIEALPMQAVLAIDVVTAIPAIMPLLFIAIPQPPRALASQAAAGAPSLWADMREGLHFMFSWRALLVLSLIGVMINMLGRAAASLTPILITKHFQGGALQLGWWQSAAGVGTVLGGVILGTWGGFRRRVVTQMVALLLDGAAIIFIGLSPRDAFVPAVAVIVLVGLLESVAIGVGGAMFQVLVPPAVQGRVFALVMSVSQALAPPGLLVAGPVADALGVQVWYVLTGAMILAMGAAGLLIPEVAHIEDRAHQQPAPA
jgi:DHA3 family macrolide efflux protein-like MFS transporter